MFPRNAWKIIEHATDLPIKYWPEPKQNPITSKTHTNKNQTGPTSNRKKTNRTDPTPTKQHQNQKKK